MLAKPNTRSYLLLFFDVLFVFIFIFGLELFIEGTNDYFFD